jgi:hypothetical protein
LGIVSAVLALFRFFEKVLRLDWRHDWSGTLPFGLDVNLASNIFFVELSLLLIFLGLLNSELNLLCVC